MTRFATRQLLALTVILSTAACPATAQNPHPVPSCNFHVKLKKLDIVASGVIDCNAGFVNEVNRGRVSYRCPKMTVFYPEHFSSYSKPGSGHSTRHVSSHPVVVVLNRCDTNWFLFIPFRDQCVVDKSFTVGVKRDYVATLCIPGVHQ